MSNLLHARSPSRLAGVCAALALAACGDAPRPSEAPAKGLREVVAGAATLASPATAPTARTARTAPIAPNAPNAPIGQMASTAAAPADRAALRVGEEGQAYASAPGAEPADAGARTRRGRYVTAAQAAQLERSFGDAAIAIEVGCCSPVEVDIALGIVWGLQAARDLPADTPVLVRGSDLRLAATTVNRLGEGGMSRVWLVTP